MTTPTPLHRPRRLRRTPALRGLTQEIRLHPEQFIWPLFIHEAPGRSEVASMPGVFRHDLDSAADAIAEARALGVRSVMLFGIPGDKDAAGSGAWHNHGVMQRAVQTLKPQFPDLTFLADTCLCEYTAHGHCGPLLRHGGVVTVDNDAALERLAQTAVSQARAGFDVVAPSAMMDGQIAAIRAGLDAAGYIDTPVMSYAVKYASAYYGPFRDAAGSAPGEGDRATYQMNPAGGYREALREAELDAAEGADFLMVKPALAYLDVLRTLREAFSLPLVAYNVSGEYAMVKAAAQAGMLDERRTVLETLGGMVRAGADAVITYHAVDAARWLREG